MSDKASLPVEDPDSGVNGANEVLNERESPLSIVGDLSRIAWRAEIANADGHSPRKSDEETEDFVAVDLEDVSDNWFLRRVHENRQSQQLLKQSQLLLNALHPFVQLLTVSNVDDCEKVEEAFPTSERASREKVHMLYPRILSPHHFVSSYRLQSDYPLVRSPPVFTAKIMIFASKLGHSDFSRALDTIDHH